MNKTHANPHNDNPISQEKKMTKTPNSDNPNSTENKMSKIPALHDIPITSAADDVDLRLVSEAFVCWARTRQIWCVEHRDDGEPGFRVTVDVFGPEDHPDEVALRAHVSFHVTEVLHLAGVSQYPGMDLMAKVAENSPLRQIELAFRAFRSTPLHNQLVLAAADLELRLGESLTVEEVERYRPLEQLLHVNAAA